MMTLAILVLMYLAVGAALFARSCLDVDARFPTMDVW